MRTKKRNQNVKIDEVYAWMKFRESSPKEMWIVKSSIKLTNPRHDLD